MVTRQAPPFKELPYKRGSMSNPVCPKCRLSHWECTCIVEPSEAAMRAAQLIWRHNVQALSRAGIDTHQLMEVPELAQIIDRGALASESGFVQHYIDALETQITTSEARNKELVEALQYISDRECEEWEMSGVAHHALTKHQGETNEPT